jgi:hypothetical protein
MRLRSWVVLMTTLITATMAMADNGYPSRTGGNYSGPRWYGYFYNNNLVSANADHTNITMVGTTEKNKDHTTQVNEAISTIRAGAKEAKKNGEQAMVDISAIVFIVTTDPSPYHWSNTFCYYENTAAATDLQTLVGDLESDETLIKNDPVNGTVSSFYVADEPDLNCLDDTIGSAFVANPALQNAITAIRGEQDTTNFPLATIVTFDHYQDMPAGMALFDWVGLDDYHHDVTAYLQDFIEFQTILSYNADYIGGTPQHLMLVPLVTNVLGSSFAPAYTDGASPLGQKFSDDNKIIGIMPFQWSPLTNKDGTPDTDGMNANSPWEPSYALLGKSIVEAAGSPPPPPVQISAAEITVIINYLLL